MQTHDILATLDGPPGPAKLDALSKALRIILTRGPEFTVEERLQKINVAELAAAEGADLKKLKERVKRTMKREVFFKLGKTWWILKIDWLEYLFILTGRAWPT